jgi:2-polyprenyl-3-methyl-5-hydroxy-6-metoxy-1,4-benzoquinol methylase
MDFGNFSFSQEEEDLLIKSWHANNSTVPLPSKLKQIFDSQDALYMNSIEAAELTFKLPYGIAYEQAQAEEYKALVEWTLQHNITLENKIIIDAGCGFGGLLACIHKKFPNSKFFGIECAQSAQERLNKTYPWLKVAITNIQGSLANLNGMLPELADVIYCTEVLEHLQHPEMAINNLLTLRKDTGALILTVPNGRADSAVQHINFWSPESWKIFVEKACPAYKIQFLKTLSPNAPEQHNLCAIIRGKR